MERTVGSRGLTRNSDNIGSLQWRLVQQLNHPLDLKPTSCSDGSVEMTPRRIQHHRGDLLLHERPTKIADKITVEIHKAK